MRIRHTLSRVACLALGISTLAAVHCTAQVFLTDADIFYADSNGNSAGHNWWTTMYSSAYHLWLKEGGVYGSSFVDVPVQLVPGTYTIGLLAEPGDLIGFHGLDLYFNGSHDPGISAYAPNLLSLSDPHTFYVNGSESTVSLYGNVAANSLTYVSGNVQVTLTDFHFGPPSLYQTDQVSAYSATPSGASDYAGAMTLQVTAVPEPCAFAGIVGMALAGFAFYRRQRST